MNTQQENVQRIGPSVFIERLSQSSRILSEGGLIDEWPNLSFDAIENIEIESKSMRIFYQSFFKLLRLPENAAKAFYTILTKEEDTYTVQ